MNKIFFFMIIAMITFSSCSSNQEVAQAKLETGIWRVALSTQGQELPFNFEVTLDSSGNYFVHLSRSPMTSARRSSSPAETDSGGAESEDVMVPASISTIR